MKKYKIEYTRDAKKKLSKMDNKVSKRITEWIKKNLDGCENPRLHGLPLKGPLRNYWRYRVGDYRIVADIQDDRIVIMIVNVDKRNDVYD